MIQQNNEVRAELGALCDAAFSASWIRNEHLIELAPSLPTAGPAPPAAASDTNTPADAAVSVEREPLPTASIPDVLDLSDTDFLTMFDTPPASPTPVPTPLTHVGLRPAQPLQNATTCWSVVSSHAALMPSLPSKSRILTPPAMSTQIP